MSCSTCGCVTQPCQCCEGIQVLTPQSVHNRPGLPALRYRVGTHGAFLQTMKARLSTLEIEMRVDDGSALPSVRPLLALTTRDSGDPSIALLDAWATVGEVLGFYQERNANEQYLRTATERRSVLELSRLVGYSLRPGVAATAYLAYTLDANQKEPVTIVAGNRAQSVPDPGEAAQAFETSDDLPAQREWNNLQVRLHRPQNITFDTALTIPSINFAGIATRLKAGDKLLLLFSEDGSKAVARVVGDVDAQFANQKTVVTLQPIDLDPGASSTPAIEATAPALFLDRLLKPLVPQFRDSLNLPRSLGQSFLPPLPPPKPGSTQRALDGSALASTMHTDASTQLLVSFVPQAAQSFYTAWAGATVNATPSALKSVHVFRARVGLFGASASKIPSYFGRSDNGPPAGVLMPPSLWTEDWKYDLNDTGDNAFLDQANDAILPGSYVLAQVGTGTAKVLRVKSATSYPRTAYGLSGPSTRLDFDQSGWRKADPTLEIANLRATQMYLQSESLTLADETIHDIVGSDKSIPANQGQPDTVQLDGLYKELVSGRWVILSGERADIERVDGVAVSELQMISGLRHAFDPKLPGDQMHTTLVLAKPLAYRYKRATLKIYGNVVKSTHGETRHEVLGNGDGAQALQSFTLRQPPLTYVASPVPAGVQSTLQVSVNDVLWREADSLAALGPKDQRFITLTDDAGNTTLTFGNGVNGARLPSGVQNVTSVYRNGIGAAGNVKAGQITLLQTRPLGVKEVLNPLRASGGADKEARDLARENAPLSVMPLDRLVSVQDYADFARRFAGIAKAIATRTSDGTRQLVYLTIAGVDDIPIDANSDLYVNLLEALRRWGDADLPVRVDTRDLLALVLGARIKIAADRKWDVVATAVRKKLLETFGFGKRALGQPALLCEVIAAIQAVRGVDYVDVDTFGAVPQTVVDAKGTRGFISPDELEKTVRKILGLAGDGLRAGPLDVPAWRGGSSSPGGLQPAELAVFMPSVPDTLVLNQIP